MASQMYKIAFAVLMLISNYGSHETPQIRRHPRCTRDYCEYRVWTSWSRCAEKCGEIGVQSRSKKFPISEGYTPQSHCGSKKCPQVTEHRRCQGVSPKDCILSSWSEWSLCEIQWCNVTSGIQTSSRQRTEKEGCGGKCIATLRTTRSCECQVTKKPNGSCNCKAASQLTYGQSK